VDRTTAGQIHFAGNRSRSLWFDKAMDKHLIIGSPTIDQQHQALLSSLAGLFDAGHYDAPDEVLSEVLSRLSQQIRHHFTTEETLMEGLPIPLPEKHAHHGEHSRILEELTQLHIDAMDGNAKPLPEIIHMVATWVTQHLIEFDLNLKPYFIGHVEPR